MVVMMTPAMMKDSDDDDSDHAENDNNDCDNESAILRMGSNHHLSDQNPNGQLDRETVRPSGGGL